MGKLICFVRAADPGAAASCRAHALEELAPALLTRLQPSRLIVDLADVDPGDPPWKRPGEASAPASSAYDAAIQMVVEDGAEGEAAAVVAEALTGWAGAVAAYRVNETIEREQRPRAAPGRSPGVKFLSLMRFHDDLPPRARRRIWAHHAGLALKVHVGMDIYVRNVVEAALTKDAPEVHGVAELHFPTMRDMRERWFDSPAGREAIIQDVGHFLHSAVRLYTSEHVIR